MESRNGGVTQLDAAIAMDRTTTQALGRGRRAARPSAGGSRLRRRLVQTDLVTATVAWALAVAGPITDVALTAQTALFAVAAVATTVALLSLLSLYRARVLPGPLHRGGAVGLRLPVRGRSRRHGRPHPRRGRRGSGDRHLRLRPDLPGAARRARRLPQLAPGPAGHRQAAPQRRHHRGRRARPARLGAHLVEHPEVGYDVVGYFRSSDGHAAHLARPVLGQAADAPAVLRELAGRRRHRGPRGARATTSATSVIDGAPGREGARAPRHRPARHRQPSPPVPRRWATSPCSTSSRRG